MGPTSTLRGFLDALFPLRCPVCGEGVDDGGPCSRHRWRTSPDGPRCGRCAARLADSLPSGFRCLECARRSPAFRRTLTLGDYGPGAPLRDWVLALKHGGRSELAEPLGCGLAEVWRRELGPPGSDVLLVPVPLHPLRRFERGYDQALLLARSLSRALERPVLGALRRRRWTDPQGTAGVGSRRANVAGVFRLRVGSRRRLEGAAVWLVDDVLTSGATACECARVLRRSGAASVGVLVAARAGSPPRARGPLGTEISPSPDVGPQ